MAGAQENNDLRKSFGGLPKGSAAGIFCKPHVGYRIAETSRMAGMKGSRSFHRKREIGWLKKKLSEHTTQCRILSEPNVVVRASKCPRSTPAAGELASSRDEGREV